MGLMINLFKIITHKHASIKELPVMPSKPRSNYNFPIFDK